jgi:hypothetical protein
LLETVIITNYLLTIAAGIINIVHGLMIYLKDTEESEDKQKKGKHDEN